MDIYWIHFLKEIYLYSIFVIPFILYFFYKKERNKAIKLNIFNWNEVRNIFSNFFIYIKLIIISFILLLFIIIISDPNIEKVDSKVKKNWIDIIIVLDISKSMEANDLKPSRIEKSKKSILKFLEKQKTNRVWLILFAWKPISSIPLTFDYNILTEVIENLTTDSLNQNYNWMDWTAVWDALLLAKQGFKDINRDKSIILLTDWDANKWVDPVIASKVLAEEWIKIYPIWIGSKKGWIVEVNNWFFNQKMNIPALKEWPLIQIANNTNWFFFRATDNNTIEKIFKKLEQLEKNNIEVKVIKNYVEYYNIFIYLLIIFISSLLFLEIRRVKN